MRLLLVLLLLALWAVALANERLPIDHVRFSASGGRVLVLTSGTRDGSGLGTASLRVLDTGSGVVTASRVRTADLPPSTLRAALLGTPPIPARLLAWGLSPGRVHPARFNRVYAAPAPQWSEATTAGQFQVTSVALWTHAVPVKLEVYAVASTCPYTGLLGGRPTAGFRLTVQAQVVHRDQELPADRRCAAGYTLERVDVQGDRALLTLRSYVPGFEGPDAEPLFIAVTLH